jgi:hypothetical protein
MVRCLAVAFDRPRIWYNLIPSLCRRAQGCRAPGGQVLVAGQGGDAPAVGACPCVLQRARVCTLSVLTHAHPQFGELGAVQQSFNSMVKSAQKLSFLNLTVKEVAVNVVVTAEVLCWFYVGEIVGRRSLIGYDA